MKATYQTSNIDMLKHGLMVNESYIRLLKKDSEYMSQLLISSEDFDVLLSLQHDYVLMRHYHIYHDCGKPFCKIIDESGKSHYPDHAAKSAEIHKKYFDCETANLLIESDMAFHTLKAEELLSFLQGKEKHIIASLYLTAWAEIFANSSMFGGFSSDSFKIKKKKLLNSFKKFSYLLK